MHVLSLFIYPVKSLRGMPVDHMVLDDFGPAGDRRWMIVDSERGFVTQRTHPALANIDVGLVDGEVVVEIPGYPGLPLTAAEEACSVKVWRDSVSARRALPEASKALSNYMDQALEFVYMPESTYREVDAQWVADRRRVGFADGYPFLIANQASLDDLNGRLDSPVDIRRFRPNILIGGDEPWGEDRWRQLAIGGERFDLVKPCSRCVMTTVDPDRGVKDPGAQPLRTLGQFRRTPNGVLFGMNAVHAGGPGLVRVGNQVNVLEAAPTVTPEGEAALQAKDSFEDRTQQE